MFDLPFILLAQNTSSHNGLLPTRASWMLDFVFVAMIAIVPVLMLSIYLVKFRGKYLLHKRMQIYMAAILLTAVVAFEADMRFGSGWKPFAVDSPYWTETGWNPIWVVLSIHLCFAIPTPFIWAFVIFRAIRKFPCPPTPCEHSRQHAIGGWIAAIGMTLTAVTGWGFYWLAFVASK